LEANLFHLFRNGTGKGMRTSFRPAPLSEFAKAFQDLQNKQPWAALHFVFSGKKGKFALFKQNKH